MSVLGRLASSIGRKDEAPNVLLAKQVTEKSDKKAVHELVENLSNSDGNIRSDCIKVLYEIGERSPGLIADYSKEFIGLLASKEGRLVWGAMTALDAIVLERPQEVRRNLDAITLAAGGESVIARDHAVSILIKLVSIEPSSDEAFKLLLIQLKESPVNQLPMYSEMSTGIADKKRRLLLAKTLRTRVNSVDKESKKRRIEKAILKLEQ